MKKLSSKELLVLLDTYISRIRAAVVKRLRPDYGVLDELIQNLYLKILDNPTYTHKSDRMFVQWAIQTVKRDYYTIRKEDNKFQYVESESELEELSIDVDKHNPTYKSFIVGSTADTTLMYHEVMAEALESLPEEQQYVLKEYESGKTLTQIAKELGISKFTAQSRYRYAKKKLKDHFNTGIASKL